MQGEILEGLVARIVPRQSSVQMEEVLKNFPQAPLDGGKVLELKLYALLSLFFQYKSFLFVSLPIVSIISPAYWPWSMIILVIVVIFLEWRKMI